MPQPNEHIFYSRLAGSSDPWAERARRVPPGPGAGQEVRLPGLSNGQAHEVALDVYDSAGRLRPPAKRDQGTVTPQTATVEPLSAGFTVDEVWQPGQVYSPHAANEEPTLTLRCLVTASASDAGIVWEMGATSIRGTAAYFHGGQSYLRYHDFSNNAIELSWTPPSEEQEMLFEIALSDHNLARWYVNRQLVAAHSQSIFKWARAGDAAAGQAGGDVVPTRGGWGPGEGSFSGSVSNVDVMVGQVPA